jgi:hypothetical protein
MSILLAIGTSRVGRHARFPAEAAVVDGSRPNVVEWSGSEIQKSARYVRRRGN